jgi:hypothetical protein
VVHQHHGTVALESPEGAGVLAGEQRRDPVPRGVGARVPVQQQEPRTPAAVPDAQRGLADVDVGTGESLEHP